ncbi:MAG: FHA domain-containing protein [Saprospiraceae bacterium]
MYTIGRGMDNDIILSHQAITEKEHFKVIISTNKSIILLHKGHNESLVNGRSFKKTPINNSDHIEIGKFKISGKELRLKILNIHYKNETDLSDEFETLINKLREFELKKNKIEDRSFGPKLLRVGLSGSVILVLVLFPSLLPDENLRYPLIAGAGVITTLLTGVTDNKAKKRKKLVDLILDFEDHLNCPKCGYSYLKVQSYMLAKRGVCMNTNCDVTFDLKNYTQN